MLIGFVICFSGIILLGFHSGHQAEPQDVLGMNFEAWKLFHKIVTLASIPFFTIHIVAHWPWFKAIVKKGLKHTQKLTFTVTIVFLIVTLTGLTAYIYYLLTGSMTDYGMNTHVALLEIHDKFGILLTVFLTIHVLRRLKWVTKSLFEQKHIHKEIVD